MGQVSPAARGLEPDILARRGLLLVVGATAVTGVLAGLSRAGVVAAWGPRYGAAHGPLFVLGVFGTLIALERAVALGRTWAFLAPVAGASGSVATPGRSRLRAVGARALGGGARRGQHRHRAPAARCVHVHHAGRVDGPVRRLPDVGHGAAPPRRGPRLDVVLRPHDRRRAAGALTARAHAAVGVARGRGHLRDRRARGGGGPLPRGPLVSPLRRRAGGARGVAALVRSSPSRASNEPVQPSVIPPRSPTKAASSAVLTRPCGSTVTVTRVRSSDSPLNTTVVNRVAGQTSAPGAAASCSPSSTNCCAYTTRCGGSMARYSARTCMVPCSPVMTKKVLLPTAISDRRKRMRAPVGGSHFARCSGFVHISNTRAMGASKVRLMTKVRLPVVASSRCSAKRSHVACRPSP
jgi:hypothetical protein